MIKDDVEPERTVSVKVKCVRNYTSSEKNKQVDYIDVLCGSSSNFCLF